jgi:glycosyltransferase involved in cell wall biosynthesis
MTLGSRPALHVAQVGFFNDPQGRAPTQLLDAWPTLVDVAEAVSRSGVRISVVQASSAHCQSLERNGVRYYFLPCGRRSGDPAQVALAAQLRQLKPDVLHVHGLGFHRDVLTLATSAPGIPIVLQDHASRPPRAWWRRRVWRRGLAVAAGIAFCATEQAQPFASAGLIGAQTRVYAIPESTSRFSPGDQQEARRLTKVLGSPAVLWVGNLDANKDPLTVLEAVSAVARVLPELRLFCCFGSAPLLPQVRRRIANDPYLRERVTLLGSVPHLMIEQLMRAADLFVLGSHHEGSGYSLIEALACGLPPVVTDIASFRSLTGGGVVGSLWPCEDARSLGVALQRAAARVGTETRAAVRAHFERELSFDALGLKLAAMYADVCAGHRGASDRCARASA